MSFHSSTGGKNQGNKNSYSNWCLWNQKILWNYCDCDPITVYQAGKDEKFCYLDVLKRGKNYWLIDYIIWRVAIFESDLTAQTKHTMITPCLGWGSGPNDDILLPEDLEVPKLCGNDRTSSIMCPWSWNSPIPYTKVWWYPLFGSRICCRACESTVGNKHAVREY